jgi:hypothetical protein
MPSRVAISSAAMCSFFVSNPAFAVREQIDNSTVIDGTHDRDIHPELCVDPPRSVMVRWHVTTADGWLVLEGAEQVLSRC